MGRKIHKSKRHKKLKPDELNHLNSNAFKLKQKQNRCPENIDIQEVPKKMLMLFESRDSLKNNKVKRKKRSNAGRLTVVQPMLEEEQYGMTRPLKPIPKKMTQMDYESTHHFLNRIQKMADKAMAEARMEVKYDVDVQVGTEKETRIVVEHKKPSEKRQKKRKHYEEKKKAKKQERNDNRIDEFAHLKDQVKFGEVATEPPVVNMNSKYPILQRTEKDKTSKLLLSRLLPSEVRNSLNRTGHSKKVNLAKKRKELSLSQRKMIEEQRQNAVSLYRKMKQIRRKTTQIKS